MLGRREWAPTSRYHHGLSNGAVGSSDALKALHRSSNVGAALHTGEDMGTLKGALFSPGVAILACFALPERSCGLTCRFALYGAAGNYRSAQPLANASITLSPYYINGFYATF